MKTWSRWALAISGLAISGWACVYVRPGDSPAAISKPSASVARVGSGAPSVRRHTDAGDRVTSAHETQAFHAPSREQDWAAQFHVSGSDYFDWVTRAAQYAYEGDGAAQYYVGRVLARCEETNALYEHADNADDAVSHLAYAPALLEREHQEYLDCRRFRDENPFKSLPERPEGYPASYWQSRAVTTGYPAAMIAAAMTSRDSSAPQVIANALATGNPEAMLLFGRTQLEINGMSASNAINAAAWILAACRIGADCSPTNEVLRFSGCSAGVTIGCMERYTAIDELTAGMGSQALGQAKLLAQDIEASLLHHDPVQLKRYVSF